MLVSVLVLAVRNPYGFCSWIKLTPAARTYNDDTGRYRTRLLIPNSRLTTQRSLRGARVPVSRTPPHSAEIRDSPLVIGGLVKPVVLLVWIKGSKRLVVTP